MHLGSGITRGACYFVTLFAEFYGQLRRGRSFAQNWSRAEAAKKRRSRTEGAFGLAESKAGAGPAAQLFAQFGSECPRITDPALAPASDLVGAVRLKQ